MDKGDKVKITGYPQEREWMEFLVGREGRVEKVNTIGEGKGAAVLVDGIPSGPVWLGVGYLEAVKEEEEGAAPVDLLWRAV
jgi:hypothetical protein